MSNKSDTSRPTPARACDSCKARKVRCDKGSPCSNCRAAGSVCRTSHTEVKEPRSRVIISKEYEKKIDRIGDRLDNIDRLLERLQNPKAPLASLSAANARYGLAKGSLPPAEANIVPSPASLSSQATSNEHEAHDATTNTHSVLASKVIEQAVGSNPVFHQNPELAKALVSLKDMVGRINENPTTTDPTKTRWSSRPLEHVDPLSRADLDEILRRADKTMILAMTPDLSASSLREKCRNVFDRPQECSTIRRVLVFAILTSLCMEYSGVEVVTPFSRRCRSFERHFIQKLEAAVNDLRLVIQPTAEAILALYHASSYAIELCKPHLALSLCSAAASMVLSLGYHRISSMQSDTEHERHAKMYRFWMVYMLDTGFSIRLGRGPTIQEHEIDVPDIRQNVLVPGEFSHIFHYWFELGRFRCRAVEQLYSPEALRQPVDERSKRASKIADSLQEAWDSRKQAFVHTVRGDVPEGFHFILQESDAIMYFSQLALIQYATGRSGESLALDAGRQALRLEVQTRKTYRDVPDHIWSAHCVWTLLHAPFTPFTVTFCHVIANPTTAHDDLRLLADFVATLQDLSYLGEGITKLHRLCDVFQKVAALYVEAKAQEATRALSDMSPEQFAQHSMQPAINDIDEYLSTIGFAPPAMDDGMGTRMQDDGFDADHLEDWFRGNSSLMGLLEQDLTFSGDVDLGIISS